MFDALVAIRGGGDMGSGIALRLWRVGFNVVILETHAPVAVRRTVSFCEAVYDGRAEVEEACAYLVSSIDDALRIIAAGQIPVLVDPDFSTRDALSPWAVVDAIMAKRHTGTCRDWAHGVIAIGPGFIAGQHVHAVVETNRGPTLGRVIWDGEAAPNTGEPGAVAGHSRDRVLRAPTAGRLRTTVEISHIVDKGDILATVQNIPLRAPFRGLVRGLARDGLEVTRSMKVGDLDPRLNPELCRWVSDKALAVAGGVLEALLMQMRVKS